MNPPVSGIPTERAAKLREEYRAALFDDFVPWWEEHSIDREYGGYYSCLGRDGRAYAGEKFTWMLARQIWMFSHLYNRHAPRPEWLEIAWHGARFLLDHAFSTDGRMHFRLARDGRPRAAGQSIYTECFAAMGLAELGRASGDHSLWDRAVEMVERIRPRLGRPDSTPLLGYPLDVQFHLHAHDMIRLTVASVFNELQPDRQWEDDLTVSARSVVDRHWKPELHVFLENVAPDGSPLLDLPEGRMVHPGHAIESAWMLIDVAHRRGDKSLLATAVEIVLSSLERSWDTEYGGLCYLTSLDGTPTNPPNADIKLWWTHAETLCALLLGWAYTGRSDLAAWYDRVHDYVFASFPDPQHGEWYGYLNRDGSVIFTAKADGRKGFFHLPRALFRGYRLLSEPGTGPLASDNRSRPPNN